MNRDRDATQLLDEIRRLAAGWAAAESDGNGDDYLRGYAHGMAAAGGAVLARMTPTHPRNETGGDPMSTSSPSTLRPRVHRAASVATWEHSHRWGTLIGDVTDLRVSRTDGGRMVISYGQDSVEIREELVPILAEMVAAAAEWSDR